MSESVSLSSFPRGRVDGLTMLYLQNQDLKGKSPEEIVVMYAETYSKISDQFKALRHGDDWFK